MKEESTRFPFLVLIVGFLSFYQSLNFSVLGVKPNLSLTILIAASFFIQDFLEGFLLIVFSAFLLKFSAGFPKEILFLTVIAAGLFFLKKYLPWDALLNNVFLVFIGTLLFYLLLSRDLIMKMLFWEEAFLNLALGALFFVFLSFMWQNKGFGPKI